MTWFNDFWDRRWNYVGTVAGRSDLVDNNGNDIPGGRMQGYWVLTEHTNGRRKAKEIGNPGHSSMAIWQRASVEAWLSGGELPELEDGPTKPTKTDASPPAKKAELVVFPGGKK